MSATFKLGRSNSFLKCRLCCSRDAGYNGKPMTSYQRFAMCRRLFNYRVLQKTLFLCLVFLLLTLFIHSDFNHKVRKPKIFQRKSTFISPPATKLPRLHIDHFGFFILRLTFTFVSPGIMGRHLGVRKTLEVNAKSFRRLLFVVLKLCKFVIASRQFGGGGGEGIIYK